MQNFCKKILYYIYLGGIVMSEMREIKDDILREWFIFREETLFCYLTEEDKKHSLKFDNIAEKIMKNVPNKSKKYVEKQLDTIYNDFMNNLAYWCEKYYRNGFIDGVQLIDECFKK